MVMGVSLLYPVLPAMVDQLQVAEAEVALIIVVFTAPAIILAPLFGFLSDFYGRRRLLISSLFIFGGAGAAVGLAPSFEWVLTFRLLQGVAWSALSPLTIVLIGDLLEDRQEISGQGLKVIIDRVAIISLPVLGGLLALISWRFPFFIYLLFVPLAILAIPWMPETRRAERPQRRLYFGGIAKAISQPRLLSAFSAGFFRFFLDYGFFTFFPLYLSASHGVSPFESGLLLSFFGVGAILSASQVGRLVQWVDRGRLLVGAFLVDAICLMIWPSLDSFLLWAVTLLAYGLANGIISPIQKNLLTQSAPMQLRGGVVSVDRMFQQIGKSSAPAILALVFFLGGFSPVFWTLGILSLASVLFATAFLALGLKRRP